jgi:hypothetical protein
MATVATLSASELPPSPLAAGTNSSSFTTDADKSKTAFRNYEDSARQEVRTARA